MNRGAVGARRRFDPRSTPLGPFVPSLVADWLRDEPGARYRAFDGTLLFADIAGFTRMTEKFATAGKLGAEQVADLINALFEHIVSAAYDYGAGVIKYGGDAALLLFEGDGHVSRACRAAVEMQAVMQREGRVETDRGPVRLRMSVGVHSGLLEFLLVGARYRELIVTGAAATTASRMEAIAEAGEIVVSAATADALAAAGERRPDTPREEGLLLRSAPAAQRRRAPLLDVDYGDLDLGVTLCATLREHIISGAVDSEHRRVTAGFIKFSGADALLAREGPGPYTAAVEVVVNAIQDAAEANAVTELGSDVYADGAKFLLISGAPRQLGHDEDRMLATVRSVLSTTGPLVLRGGVNSGRVFMGTLGPPYRRTYSLLGDSVNLAARLMQHAPAGELLTTGHVIKQATGNFVITAIAPFAVKGKREPVQAFSVGHSLELPAVRAVPATDPIVGRERELETLLEADADAAAGRGRVIEIVGLPGMGKSRLLDELRARTRGDYLHADGDIYAAATPYAPFERMLRARLGAGDQPGPAAIAAVLASWCADRAPHLTPWLPLIAVVAGLELESTPEVADTDPANRKELLEAMTSELLGALLDRPTTLVFNDLHLMDDASAHLVARLAADAASRPWLVVTTRRPAGGEDPVAEGVTRIDLEPLGAEAAEALLAQLTAGAPLSPHRLSRLARQAGGNPLFLRELVARVREGGDPDTLPDSVEAAIASRIDRLAPRHRRLMRSASVLGVVVDVPLLSEVIRDDDRAGAAALGELDSLDELLEPIDLTRRRFTHELVRTVAYEGLPYRRREVLHARTAEVIERTAADAGQQADILSLHCLHGALFEPAWRYSRIAAERAQARYANAEAAECFQRALTAAPRVPELEPAELAEVDQALGDMYFELGEFHASEVSLLRARRRPGASTAVTVAVDMKMAKLRESSGQHDAALRWLGRAARAIEASPDPEARHLLGRLLARRARLRYRQGRPANALRVATRAIEVAQASRDLRALGEALEIADYAELALGVPDATARIERALAIYTELDDLGGEARVRNTLGAIAYFRGRWPEAVAHYRAAADAYTRSGQRWAAANSGCNIAEVLADQGHLAEAEAELERAIPVLRGVGARSELAFGQCQLGKVAARRGRTEEALTHFAAARSYHQAASEVAEAIVDDGLTAECLVLAGEPAEALLTADEALGRAGTLAAAAAAMPLLHRVRGSALLGLGRRGEAAAALLASLDAARAREASHDVAFALRDLLSAEPPIGGSARPGWQAELERLRLQLGIVA
jgi:class 3 adenylate cyclase/tetratricopeptide (TPR) repeat protein